MLRPDRRVLCMKLVCLQKQLRNSRRILILCENRLGPCSGIATVCVFKWIIVNASLLEELQRAAIDGDILASLKPCTTSKDKAWSYPGMKGLIVPLQGKTFVDSWHSHYLQTTSKSPFKKKNNYQAGPVHTNYKQQFTRAASPVSLQDQGERPPTLAWRNCGDNRHSTWKTSILRKPQAQHAPVLSASLFIVQLSMPWKIVWPFDCLVVLPHLFVNQSMQMLLVFQNTTLNWHFAFRNSDQANLQWCQYKSYP